MQEDIEDNWENDDSGEDESDYWYCMGCTIDRAKKPPYGHCPICGSIMEECYY